MFDCLDSLVFVCLSLLVSQRRIQRSGRFWKNKAFRLGLECWRHIFVAAKISFAKAKQLELWRPDLLAVDRG